MEKEKILNEYVKLIDKGYCEDCNELNCIDNFPHKKIASAICDLQLENTKLKGQLKKQKEVIDKIMNLIKQYGKYDGKKCTRGFQMWNADFNKILDILKEVSE